MVTFRLTRVILSTYQMVYVAARTRQRPVDRSFPDRHALFLFLMLPKLTRATIYYNNDGSSENGSAVVSEVILQ